MSRESKLIVFVAVLASLLEIIDSSIVNVAIPTMMGNLGATLEDISMVITSYAIANAIILPLSAWLSMQFGRRPYYLGCIALFTVVSVLCGIAPNLWTLILFRIAQGLVGGALLPTSQALIYEQFPKEKAGMAGAIFGMSVMIGPTLGPTLGGYLTDHFGWRSIFNINLPLGMLALFIGWMVIKNPNFEKHQPKTKVDVWGLLFLTLSIGCLQWVLERGDSEGWLESKLVIINILAVVIFMPLFIWWELRISNPIINLRLFKNGIVANGVLLMSAIGLFLYSIVFVLPIFVGRVYHYSATQTGMLFIPGSLLTAFMMPFIGKAMQKISAKKLIFVGLISIEICCIALANFSPDTSKTELYMAMYLRGFAMAFLFVPINSSILSQFKGVNLGQVSGLLNLSRQIGGSMGIALVATMMSMKAHQNYADLSAKVHPFRPLVYQTQTNLNNGMTQKMSSAVGLSKPSARALKILRYKIDNQVFARTFIQLVRLIGLVFLLSFIPWYFLKFKKVEGPIDTSAAH